MGLRPFREREKETLIRFEETVGRPGFRQRLPGGEAALENTSLHEAPPAGVGHGQTRACQIRSW